MISAEGIPVVPLGMGLGRPTLKGLATFYHLLKQESIDIVQTWLYHADLLGFLVGRFAEVKRIVWGIRCSDMHLRKYRPMTALTVRLCGVLSPLVDAIIVNSSVGRRIHENRGYQTERMVLIPNGFQIDRFKPDASAGSWLRQHLGLSEDTFLIGMVARFDLMKDHATFLKAASILSREEKNVHFILVGKGMDPENPQLARLMDAHLKARVHLLGLRHDIPRIMAGLDIASSSSAFGEGFSNTIGEAMACGIPCVVTKVGDSPFVVGNTGIVVPPVNPEKLAEGWRRILHMDREERKRLGRDARSRIVEEYDLDQIVERFQELYERLMPGKG
jgi:glycosyltransferase involved in cell wall biosynthesis